MINIVKGLLTRDSISRKNRKWHLLTSEEMEKLHQNPRCISSYGDDEEIYVSSSVIYSRKSNNWNETEQNMISSVKKTFPFLQVLLEKFEGKIVAAGGAICKSFYFYHRPHDIDLFFIDKNYQETEILMDAVSFLVECCSSVEGTVVYVTRNEYVTTVYACKFENDELKEQKYQFIHRLYPNIGSILGGFDIGFCMVAYTGRKIVATELGAWSLFNGYIIVDTTRRSTSYEHRLSKYFRYCDVIFPGITQKVIKDEVAKYNLKDSQTIYLEMMEFLRQNKTRIVQNGQGDLVFVPIDEDKEQVKEQIKTLAMENGYHVSKITLEEVRPHRKFDKNEENRIKYSLEKIAKTNHFSFMIGTFMESVYGSQGHRPCDPFEGLIPRPAIFRMPYFSISVGRLQIAFPTKNFKNPKYLAKISDYEDDQTFLNHVVMENATNLVNEGKYVKSVIVFKTPRTEDPITKFCCKNGFIPRFPSIFDTIENVCEPTSREQISKEIRKFYEIPYLGNLEKAFEMRLKYYRDKNFSSTFLKRRTRALFGSNEEQDVTETVQKIERNAILAREKLRGVNWIKENPGRQWTSSINPIMEDPREWYGSFYQSFRIGCEDVETTLRLIRREKKSLLYNIDINLFNHILSLIVWENSFKF